MSRDSHKDVCVLVSGGLDSAALIAYYLRRKRTVHPVYIESGYRWEKAERRHLRRLLSALSHRRLKALRILKASVEGLVSKKHWAFLGSVPGIHSRDAAVFLPGRNVLLISCAAVYCAQKNVGVLALATLRGNPFLDATKSFFARMEKALRCGLGRPLKIEAPFRDKTKKNVVAETGGVPWPLTFSCLRPSGLKPCGRCNKCEERRRVLNCYNRA